MAAAFDSAISAAHLREADQSVDTQNGEHAVEPAWADTAAAVCAQQCPESGSAGQRRPTPLSAGRAGRVATPGVPSSMEMAAAVCEAARFKDEQQRTEECADQHPQPRAQRIDDSRPSGAADTCLFGTPVRSSVRAGGGEAEDAGAAQQWRLSGAGVADAQTDTLAGPPTPAQAHVDSTTPVRHDAQELQAAQLSPTSQRQAQLSHLTPLQCGGASGSSAACETREEAVMDAPRLEWPTQKRTRTAHGRGAAGLPARAADRVPPAALKPGGSLLKGWATQAIAGTDRPGSSQRRSVQLALAEAGCAEASPEEPARKRSRKAGCGASGAVAVPEDGLPAPDEHILQASGASGQRGPVAAPGEAGGGPTPGGHVGKVADGGDGCGDDDSEGTRSLEARATDSGHRGGACIDSEAVAPPHMLAGASSPWTPESSSCDSARLYQAHLATLGEPHTSADALLKALESAPRDDEYAGAAGAEGGVLRDLRCVPLRQAADQQSAVTCEGGSSVPGPRLHMGGAASDSKAASWPMIHGPFKSSQDFHVADLTCASTFKLLILGCSDPLQ